MTDTQPEMVSAPDPLARRGPRWWGIVALLLGLTGPGVIFGQMLWLIPENETAKSYAYLPGDATSAISRLDTGELQAYNDKGDVLFVTVSQLRLNALTKALTEDEPSAALATRKEALGDRNPQEERELDRKLMTYSKDFAAFVALTHLGYDIKVRDGGVVVGALGCDEFDANEKCIKEAPASKVLKPKDLITGVDGKDINISKDLTEALAGKKRGDVVRVEFERLGETGSMEADIELIDNGTRAIIGIISESSPPDSITFEIPSGVSIDSGSIGGPSAGLAFTLALLEDLTPGQLTGGAKVAATGTMAPNGLVGEVGRVEQKAVAVHRAGATVFLVPERQVEEALKGAAGTDLKVIGVGNLDDALTALAELGGNALELGKPGAAVGG